MRLRFLLVTLVVLMFGVSAEARCFQCDQTTGYDCFMAQGAKAGCDSPSGAGCFTWGTCTPGQNSGDGACLGLYPYCDPFELIRATPMSNDLEVADVTVSPTRSKTPAPATHTSA